MVELTIVTDEFLSAKDRKRLNEAHSGIINIIPEIKNKTFTLNRQGNIDLSKSIEQLFIDYFHHIKAQSPDEAIIELFKEVLGAED